MTIWLDTKEIGLKLIELSFENGIIKSDYYCCSCLCLLHFGTCRAIYIIWTCR